MERIFSDVSCEEVAGVPHRRSSGGAGMEVPGIGHAPGRCGPSRPTDWVAMLAPCGAPVAAVRAWLLAAVATFCPALHRDHCARLEERCFLSS